MVLDPVLACMKPMQKGLIGPQKEMLRQAKPMQKGVGLEPFRLTSEPLKS